MLEIERKFLVLSEDFKKEAISQKRITQAYLSSNPERTIRVRIKEDKGFLTVKGKGNASGTTRLEWETEIPLEKAQELFALCEEGIIEKIRYEVRIGIHLFEVDVFQGENEGLILAEVELHSEEEYIEFPYWLGTEVTGDQRFYNAYLSKNPFKTW